jgi:tryptophan halogenase
MEHAYHFDATRYAPLLRRHAVARGVQRIEGRVVDVELRGEDGFIESVTLSDGRTLAADLFIDCSGFRGLLIEGALSAGYEDWRHWLPCDRAVAAPCARTAPMHPYTQSIAEPAGWRWRIPLQHRIGNGYVFCSGFVSDEEASRTLLEGIEAPASAAPRFLPFVTGHRRRMWFRNCVAIGLSSGFLEPLESTSIYLIHRAVMLLSELFPDRLCDPVLAETYDRTLIGEFRQIRDFLVLHYSTAQRDDTPFWRHCRAIPLPDTLAHKLALFEERGVIMPYQHFFNEVNWRAVLSGQGVIQRHWDPRLDGLDDIAVREAISRSATATRSFVMAMPSHEDYVTASGGRPSA